MFDIRKKSFSGGSVEKNLPANEVDVGSITVLGRSPGEGNGNSLFLPEKSHGQKSLEGYSPWVTKSQTQIRD